MIALAHVASPMGLDLCWIGVEARFKERLLDFLGLEPAGDVGDELGADFTLAETPNAWVVVASRAGGLDLDEALAGVSSVAHFAIGFEIMEVVTFSRASASRDGKPLWSVIYNDRDQGEFVAEGDLPVGFANIRAQRASEDTTASPDGDFLFEVPADLAEEVTGYRPGQLGLEWKALRKKRTKPVGSARAPRSLRTAMFAVLIPLLRSLGWESTDRPVLNDMDQIRRTVNGVEQTLWFDYGSGQETYVIVHFFARAGAGQEEFAVGGRVTAPRIRLPIWKRFTWKRLGELTRSEPPPADIVAAVIDRACEEIGTADRYLRDWAPDPCILLDYSRPEAEWPTPTSDADAQARH